MKNLFRQITVLFLLLTAAPAAAWDVLVVQNFQARPYQEVLRGFKSTCNAGTSTLLVSDMDGDGLAREVRRRSPDMVLALGMDALRKVMKIRDIPIVYCMVLNPESVLNNERNITGVSMTIPPDRQLSALAKVLPNLKRIGLVYNPGKTGRVVEQVREATERRGIRLTALKAESARELPARLASLPDSLDAYWMLPDNTFTSSEAVESLILYSMNNKVPIFTFSEKYLQMGAFMSLDLDIFGMGRQAGEMATKVRDGVEIGRIPRSDAERGIPAINRTVARKLGIRLEGDSSGKSRNLHD